MAKIHKWCDSESVVAFRGDNGEEYCLFHAPMGKKGISREEFNERIFKKIYESKKQTVRFCNFSGTIYEGDIDFRNFNKFNPLPIINFTDAVFSGKADFKGTKFEGQAFFKKADFRGAVDLNTSIFDGYAIFEHAVFNEKAEFKESQFNEMSSFAEAVFKKEMNLSHAKFGKETKFTHAHFHDDAYFALTEFCAGANLAASFSNVIFMGAIFKKKTYFGGASFKAALFNEAVFNESVNFGGSSFDKGATFHRVTFDDRADFGMTRFGDSIDFSEATIRGDAIFSGHLFPNGANFNGLILKGSVIFENIKFERVSFLKTDLRKATFINPTWSKKYGRFVLYDELKAFERGKKQDQEIRKDIKAVEVLYRRLKQKYKEEHDEPEVSNWHYGEKEMFRKGSPYRRYFPLSLSNLYWFSSGYGERPVRAGIFLIFLLILTSLLLAWAGLAPSQNVTDNVHGMESIYLSTINPGGAWALFLNTLKYATFQRDFFFVPQNWIGETIKIFAQLFIPVQTALFALAVRNRFRR